MRLDVDHVTVCGSELAAMRQAFAGVGLVTTYGGSHGNGATHVDLLTFADGSYLELIAPMARLTGAPGMMGGWAQRMEGDAGPGAWAVRSDDIQVEAARLRAAGIEVRGPEAGGRKRPDGVALAWETALVGEGPAGSVLPFVIQDKTDRGLRVPESSGSVRSLLTGVEQVVLGVRDLAKAVQLFRRAYETEVPNFSEREGMKVAYFPDAPVILASPVENRGWLAERQERFGDGPVAFLLGTRVLNAAAERHGLGRPEPWFGRKAAWFDAARVRGARLGVMEC